VQCSKSADVELMRMAWRSVGAIITGSRCDWKVGVAMNR
jgi:hypothetical protein